MTAPVTFPIGQDRANDSDAPETSALVRLRGGDLRAFEQLIRDHQTQVFNFCARMLSDREEASDLTQEIFLAVHQHLPSFRMDSKLSTWIFRIAHNHCLNRLKYLRRRGNGRSDSLEDVPESTFHDLGHRPERPDDLLSARGEQAAVHRAIAQLGFSRYVETVRTLRSLGREQPPPTLSSQVLRRIRWQNRLWAPRRLRLFDAAHRVPAETTLLLLLAACAAALLFALSPS